METTQPTFEMLIGANKNKLEQFASRYTKNYDDAADLVQDTMLKAYNYFHHFIPGTNFSAWLLVIMRNTFINTYRAGNRRKLLISVEEELCSTSLMLSSTKNNAEHSFLGRDIALALAKLPDHLRDPFILHFEGYKYEEIADQFDMPLGTVKTRIHHARTELKKQLKMYHKDRA